MFSNDVSGFWAFEREGEIFGIIEAPDVERAGFGVANQILAGVDGGEIGEAVGIDVVAASAEIVVGEPGVGGGEDGDLRLWFCGGDDPGEREEFAGFFALGVEVVEAGALGAGDELGVVC